ncbi:MAG: hypothetical protein ACRBG0_22275 [Lewinella sp.]|uniref:hypothetical protein n=1 Tax=Lewinella sp. TaxID=2004506 RepID=UPI003D6BF688
MNPLMLWDAEMNDALEGAKDEGLINLEKEWYNLPVSDQEQLSELPDIMQSLYTYANGVEIRWRSIQDSSQGGRLQFLELEHVFKDGLGQLYDTEDLLEEELIEFFKPFDLVTDEAECGFLHRPGFASESIYYHRTGTPQLYNLDIDFSGYLEMALAARVYYYWPKVLLDIQSGTKGAETVNFKQNMPLIFPEFNWEAFKEKYQSLRLSVK